MSRVAIRVGPADHGRRMSLADFDRAEGAPGYLYELSRGRIIVVGVPDPSHFVLVEAVRDQLSAYKLANRGRIYAIGTGSECKLLINDLESERHPDLAVYKSAPPGTGAEVWAKWIPEIVIEIVSRESAERDYVAKREDYLSAGVKEYWIVDAARREILVLRRHRDYWTERVLGPNDTYTTRLLPGFELACAPIFEAASGYGG